MRIAWIDIAKGIAIIGVIVSHTVANDSIVRDFLFSFHMPLFFILAGYTFRVKPLKESVAASARRLLVPYVIIFAMWQGLHWVMGESAFSVYSLANLFGIFVFASGMEVPGLGIAAVGMTWFLVCLFVARLLLRGVVVVSEKSGKPILLQGVAATALAAVGVFVGDCLNVYLPLSFDVAFVAAWFMWIGYIAKETKFMAGTGSKWYVFVLFVLFWAVSLIFSDIEMATREYGIPFLSLPGAVAATFVVCRISEFLDGHFKAVARFLMFMGENSMLIYCFHAIDWFVPWGALASLNQLPLPNMWVSLARLGYNSLLVLLVKKV